MASWRDGTVKGKDIPTYKKRRVDDPLVVEDGIWGIAYPAIVVGAILDPKKEDPKPIWVNGIVFIDIWVEEPAFIIHLKIGVDNSNSAGADDIVSLPEKLGTAGISNGTIENPSVLV